MSTDQARAGQVAAAQARLRSGNMGSLNEDLELLKKSAPASLEALWQRECAGRVTGKSYGELGMGVEFKGNAAYDAFCKRTSKAERERAPARFGG